MKTPHWWQTKNVVALLLWPASLAWRLATCLRTCFAKAEKLPVAVWCVGNVAAGGGGKTPFCLYLGEQTKRANIDAYFIARGYGGSLPGPLLVDPKKHTSDEVGDEALLLAETLPTIIAHKRIEAAKLAVSMDAAMLIMDDGMQYPHLHKDKTFLLLKGDKPLGNGLIMPAGPLRESFARALNRSDVVVRMDARARLNAGAMDVEVWHANTMLDMPELQNKKVIGFAGIAHPELFKWDLMDTGLEVIQFHPFADHHPYQEGELAMLVKLAKEQDAALVTTLKDWVRLDEKMKEKIIPIRQSFTLEEADRMADMLHELAIVI